jgi:diketogulonate reductase-like aldo/keto reductase
LRGGGRMPVLGLGVWQMKDGREVEQAVEWALTAGYRHVDTASIYRNERGVGAALRRSGLPREELFVTTKLNPARLNVARELKASLDRLDLDYVDLYLIHWPVPLLVRRHWRAVEALHEQGLARAIGVSNCGRGQLASLLQRATHPLAVNQVQFSPLHYRRMLLDYCQAQGIMLEAYSPLERGRALQHPTIVAIANRLERTPAQVLLRWAIQHGAIVIPKSSQRVRIQSNAHIFDFALEPEDMRTLDALDRTGGAAHARR